jgi:hypothetical protein
MNKFFKSVLPALLLLTGLATINSSCDKEFDQPPVYVPPSITANTSIKQLKALLVTSGVPVQVTTDIIIRGIVIGDDKSGNLYKNLVIQDETAGILIRMDGTNLFTSYPVGTELFVKCRGLYLGDYNRLIQLGGGLDNSSTPPSVTTIASGLFNQYLVKGSSGNVVVPKVVTVSQLTTDLHDSLQNRLIKLEGFEFAAADTSKTYANVTVDPPVSVNFVLRNCSASTITLRNSGFADFAPINVPNGNGSIVAIYSVFGNTKQLTIRDTSDVQFTGARCTTGGGGGGGGGTGTELLNETFESLTTTGNPPIALTGWTNLAEAGTRRYDARTFSSNKYAQITAFGSNDAALTSWLVTKAVDLGAYATKTLTFDSKAGFANGATLKVLVSTNFTGTGNPWASGVTWTDITSQATLSPGQASGYPANFTSSGSINLNSYTGTIYIAFKYEGADPAGTGSDKTTTWQLDNIKVLGN